MGCLQSNVDRGGATSVFVSCTVPTDDVVRKIQVCASQIGGSARVGSNLTPIQAAGIALMILATLSSMIWMRRRNSRSRSYRRKIAMVLIFTVNQTLAQGLSALISTIVGAANITVVKTMAALQALDTGAVSLVVVDGSLPTAELRAFLQVRTATANFPSALLLLENTDQAEIAQREQVAFLLKGSAPAELISVLQILLQ